MRSLKAKFQKFLTTEDHTSHFRWSEKKRVTVYPEFNRKVSGIHIPKGDIMARKVKYSYTLEQIITLMIDSKIAEGKSWHTISDYRNTFRTLYMRIPGVSR